jgi:hypothetical protein
VYKRQPLGTEGMSNRLLVAYYFSFHSVPKGTSVIRNRLLVAYYRNSLVDYYGNSLLLTYYCITD